MFNTAKTITFMLGASLFGLLGACVPTEPKLPVPVEQLATQIYLPIGTRVFRIPLIALVSHSGSPQVYLPSRPSSESAVTAAAREISELISRYSAAPISLAGVAYANIKLGTFSYLTDTKADTSVSTIGLCPLLKHKWAFELCTTGMMDGENKFWPKHFTLMDEKHLKDIRPVLGYYGDRKETVGDVVLAMMPYSTEPKVFCGVNTEGKQSTLCTVVMRLDQHLLVIWTTSSESIADNKIALQAKSIRLFLEFGVGETENYEALQNKLRRLHRLVIN